MSLSEISEAEGRGGGQFTVLEESAKFNPHITSYYGMCSQVRPVQTTWHQVGRVSVIRGQHEQLHTSFDREQ